MWRRKPKDHAPSTDPRLPVLGAESVDSVLRRLHWTVIRPLAAQLGGDERSLLRGPGMELSDVREYQPGDDIRHIDWNITARTDQPYVREAQAERALDVWLVVDVSHSIDWGTAQCLKRDRAVEFAAIAGQLLSRRGHRVGTLLFADRPISFVPPASGRLHLQRIIGCLRDERAAPAAGTTDLAAALHKTNSLIRRRALVLVVSDFLVSSGWQAPLRQLAQRHEVIAVRLHDPHEAMIPDIGLATFEDPETGAQVIVDTGNPALRERFAQAARDQAEHLQSELVRSDVDHLALSTDADLLPTLIRFLSARRLRKPLQRGSRPHRAAHG